MGVKILHSADIQIKARTPELFHATKLHLEQLQEILELQKPDVYVISGDLFEYGNTAGISDDERKLMYNHLSSILKITELKELVIIDGNHDIHPATKSQEITDTNSIDTFATVIKALSGPESQKLKYLNSSGVYPSFNNKWLYYVVSLKSNEEFPELNNPGDGTSIQSMRKPIIGLWHGMLKEYVDSENLPLRGDLYRKLISVEQFPENSWILSGDIHKRLRFKGSGNQRFIYPGSTMQHTHSEGDYVHISEEGVKYSRAESKALSMYAVTDTTGIEYVGEVQLPSAINYTTINLISGTDIPFGVIKNYLSTLELSPGTYQHIKIKTSNLLLKHENEIRELIGDLVGETQLTINFDYEKYVQKTQFDNRTAETITKIIEEKSEELKSSTGFEIKEDDIITASNIDKLILNNQQIIELFKAVLNPVLKTIKNEFPGEITTEQIESDILAIFEDSLNKSLESAPRYNIRFKDIYTSNFMLLGENTIKLDIPGIVRILGTNGIGKTTLYNMMRWVIKGDLFEGMSKVTKVKNACMCFNNTKLDDNRVCVILNSEINGQAVTIERTLERKWKNPETINPEKWEDNVSTIDQALKVIIVKKDGTPITIIGEKAQKHLDTWFGKTVDNIMILNHQKLERILKAPASEINELILEFIGVEYLRKLDLDLELIKSELMTVAKPKRDSEAIFQAKIDCNIYIKNINQNIQEFSEQNKQYIQELQDFKQEQKDLNAKLLNWGNIPSKIRDTSTEISELKSKIDNFQPKQLLEPKKVDFESPRQPDLLELNSQKEQHLALIEKIDIAVPKLTAQSTNICGEINQILSEQEFEAKEQIQKLTEQIESYKQKKTELFGKLVIGLTGIYTKKLEVESIIRENISQQLSDKNSCESRITKINNDIISGVCSTCGRPFAEDFESHKKQLETEREELQKQLKDITTNIFTYQENLNHIIRDKEYLEKLKNLARNENQEVFNCFVNQEIKTALSSEATIPDSVITINFEIKKIQDSIESVKQKIVEYNKFQRIERFNLDYVNTMQSAIPVAFPPKFKDLYSALKEILEKIDKLGIKQSSVNRELQSINNEISTKQNQYTTELNDYNRKLRNIQDYNNNISQENQKIMDYNQQESLWRNELVSKEKDLQILDLQLPEYNATYMQYTSLTNTIDEVSKQIESNKNQIHVKELNRKEYENQLSLLEDEYQNLIKYTKNQIIWKIYSKLIKDSFKDIVFDYYRTYLNNTLNYLLSDVTFKLYWNRNSELTFSNIRNGYNSVSKVQLASNMEIAFMGLSLIYTIHVLNVKNNISHIFIDELSGALNRGIGLTYDARDYQELFVKIINKFKDKTVFIIDHHIQNLFETICYQVTPTPEGSKYVALE